MFDLHDGHRYFVLVGIDLAADGRKISFEAEDINLARGVDSKDSISLLPSCPSSPVSSFRYSSISGDDSYPSKGSAHRSNQGMLKERLLIRLLHASRNNPPFIG